jgi:hypothetical protein
MSKVRFIQEIGTSWIERPSSTTCRPISAFAANHGSVMTSCLARCPRISFRLFVMSRRFPRRMAKLASIWKDLFARIFPKG